MTISNITNNNSIESLYLVDFSTVSPDALKQQVIRSIELATQFLDNLTPIDLTPKDDSITSQTALNDIIEFDHLNIALDRSWGVLSHLNSVMSNDDIRHVHHELLPKLSAYGTKVGQHKPLFSRYQMVQNDVDFYENLEPARQRAIVLALQSFQLSGVMLAEDKQQQYADVQSKLSTLSANFSDNILDATQAFALPLEPAQLQGLTESGLAMLAQAGEEYKKQQAHSKDTKNNAKNNARNNAKNKKESEPSPEPYYVATLDVPIYMAIMTHADDRSLRERMYRAYVTRASEFDTHSNNEGESLNNAENMTQILKLRQQKSQLLGFANYAELSLSTKMADDVATVETFLRDLAQQAAPSAKRDLQQLEQAAKTLGIDELQPWDTAYVAEKLKQDKFKLSQEAIRPYFPLPTVIAGLFDIVNRLYGIKAVEYTDETALWHDDVRFYQLYDTHMNSGNEGDDTLIGGFYFDLYARTGKRGGAWMSGFQPRYAYISEQIDDLLDTVDKEQYSQLPVCFMIGNFTPPNGDKPSLLTHNEVITLFHEFGHGLHHLLTAVSIGDVAGVNGVEWDAVELPSQLMENWAWDAEGIALISAHVETGEPLPQDQLDALLAAKNFQSGMQTLRQIEFALFDILIHARTPAPNYEEILTILEAVRSDVAIIATPDYNRFANGFSHIFAGGYAAGYYSYKWAELLSADAFSKFEEEGIFNPVTGAAFRESVLSRGGSFAAKTNYEHFRGRPANIDALLRHSGFVDTIIDTTVNGEG